MPRAPLVDYGSLRKPRREHPRSQHKKTSGKTGAVESLEERTLMTTTDIANAYDPLSADLTTIRASGAISADVSRVLTTHEANFSSALAHARSNDGASTDAVLTDTDTMRISLDAIESIVQEGTMTDIQAHYLRRKAALSAELLERATLVTKREEQVRRAKPGADIALTDAAITAQNEAIQLATTQMNDARNAVDIAAAETASVASLSPPALLEMIVSLRAEGSADLTKQIRLRVAEQRERTLAVQVPAAPSDEDRDLFLRLNTGIAALSTISPESVAALLRSELSTKLSPALLTRLSAMLTSVAENDEMLRTETLEKRTSVITERDALQTTLTSRMTSEFNAIIASRQTVQAALDLLRTKSQAYERSIGIIDMQRNRTATDNALALLIESAAREGSIPSGVSLLDLEQQLTELTARRASLVSWKETVVTRIAAGESYDLTVIQRELEAIDSVLSNITTVKTRMLANINGTLNAAYGQRLPTGVSGSATWQAFVASRSTLNITQSSQLTDELKTVMIEGRSEWQKAQNPLTTQVADLSKQLVPMHRIQSDIAALQAKADSMQRGAEALRLFASAHGLHEVAKQWESTSPLQSALAGPALQSAATSVIRTIVTREAARTSRANVIGLVTEAAQLLSGPEIGKVENDISLLQQQSQVLIERESAQVLKVGELRSLMQQTQGRIAALDGAASSTRSAIISIEDSIARGLIVSDGALQVKLTQLRADLASFAAERTTLVSESNTQQNLWTQEQTVLTGVQADRTRASTELWKKLSAQRRFMSDMVGALGDYDLAESATPAERLAHSVDVQNALEKAFLRTQQEFHDIESAFAISIGDLVSARRQTPTNADILLGGNPSLPLTLPAGASSVSQSPSGDRLAYLSGSTLIVEAIDTRIRTASVALTAPLASVNWSPSGSRLLVLMTNGAALSLNAANGSVITTHTFEPALGVTNLRYAKEGTNEVWQAEGIVDPVTRTRGSMLVSRSALTGAMTPAMSSAGAGLPVLGGNQMLSFVRSGGASTLTLREKQGALAGEARTLAGSVLTVVESADSRTLFAITTQGTVYAFSSSVLEPLAEVSLGRNIVDAVASSGGRFLVVLDSTGTLHVLSTLSVNDRVPPTIATTIQATGATKIIGISEREITVLTPSGITLCALPAPAAEPSVPLNVAMARAQKNTEEVLRVRGGYAALFQLVTLLQQSIRTTSTEMLIANAQSLAKAAAAMQWQNLPPETARQIQSLVGALEGSNQEIASLSAQASSLVSQAISLIRTSDLTPQSINWTQPPATRGVPEGALGSFVAQSGANIYGTTLSQAGGMMITYGQDGRVNFWHPKTAQKIFSINGNSGSIYSGDVSPDGSLAVFGTLSYPSNTANRLIFVDPHSGMEVASIPATGLVAHIRFSPQGDTLLAGCTGTDGSLLIDVATRTVLARFQASHKGVFFDEGRKILFTGESGGGGLFIYDIATNQTQSIGNPFGNCDIYAIESNVDGTLIGIAGRKERERSDIGSFALLDSKTLQVIGRTVLNGAGLSIVFSPSAPLVSVQPSNQSAVTYDLRSLRSPQGLTEMQPLPYFQGGLLGPASDSVITAITGYMYWQAQYSRWALAHPTQVALQLPTLPDYTYQTTAGISQSLADVQGRRAEAIKQRATHEAALNAVTATVSLSEAQVQVHLDRLLEDIQRLINPSYTPYLPLPNNLATKDYPERMVIGSTVIDSMQNSATGTRTSSVIATSSVQTAAEVRTLLAAGEDLSAGSTLASLSAQLAALRAELTTFDASIKSRTIEQVTLFSQITRLTTDIAALRTALTRAEVDLGWTVSKQNALVRWQAALTQRTAEEAAAKNVLASAQALYTANRTPTALAALRSAQDALQRARAGLEEARSHVTAAESEKSRIVSAVAPKRADIASKEQLLARLQESKRALEATIIQLERSGRGVLEGKIADLEGRMGRMNAIDDAVGTGGELLTEFTSGVDALIDRGVLGNPTPEAIAGASNAAGRSRRELYTQAQRWALPQKNGVNYTLGGRIVARTDTVAGRIIAGAANNLWITSDTTSRWTMAFMAQSLTNIPAYRFIRAREKGVSEQQFAAEMVTLLQDAQYGHIPSSNAIASSRIIVAATDRTLYTDHTSPVRIRFDLPMDARNIRSINVLNGSTLLAQNAGATFVEIPPTQFAMLGAYTLTLRITTDEGNVFMQELPRIITAYTQAPGTPEGLVPLPSNAPNTPEERKILEAMRFPFENKNWNYGLASNAHDGPLRYALDFNAPNDETSVIRAPIKSSVSKVDLYKGEVTLSSSLPSGEKWKMQFLHMDHIFDAQLSAVGKQYTGIAEAIRLLDLETTYKSEIMDNNGGNMPGLTSTLFRIIKEKIPKAYELLLPYEKKIDEAQKWINDNVVGTEIPSWTVIGQGGDEGASDGTHVHMHVIKNDGVPINLYAWADAHEPGILAKVKIDKKSDKYPMKYDNAVGALVNASEQIVHKRVEATNAVSENWAYALESSLPVSQMKRVVWMTVHNVRKPDNTLGSVDFWIKEDEKLSPTKYWNAQAKQFLDIPR